MLIFLPDCTARVNDEVTARTSKSIEFLMIFSNMDLRQLVARVLYIKEPDLNKSEIAVRSL